MLVKMIKQHIFIIENNLQKVRHSFFHLSRRTTMVQDLFVRRQFSLVPDNRANVNVEAWIFTFAIPELLDLIRRKIGFLPYVV